MINAKGSDETREGIDVSCKIVVWQTVQIKLEGNNKLGLLRPINYED